MSSVLMVPAKPTTQHIDSIAWEALTTQLGISSDSVAWLNLQIEETTYNNSGMTDEEILFSKDKDNDIGTYKVGIGCMACKEDEIDAFIDRMLVVSSDLMNEKERDMLFAMIDKRLE